MRRVERQVTQERLVVMLVNESECVIGQIVREVSVPLHSEPVVIQRRAEVVPPVSRRETVELIESTVERVIG